jgi:ribosomal protein L24
MTKEHAYNELETNVARSKPARPLDCGDVVRITAGKMKGKTGVVVRLNDDNVCVVLTSVWDHGVWFGRNETKRIGKVRL